MIVYSLLGITLLIALLCLWLLWYRGGRVYVNIFSALLLPLALGVFIYLYGAWVFLSVKYKIYFAVCFAGMLITFFLRRKSGTANGVRLPSVMLASVLLLLDVLYFTGTAWHPYGIINLALPFKHGRYFVFQGGRGLPTNVFHFTGRGTAYAMDIIKLTPAGGRGKYIFSKELKDYAIFGDTIYSPCDGVISRAEYDNPDNIPPVRTRGPHNLNGVVIETPAAYIFLGHMKYNSVFVKAGDSVYAGQPLGLAGNSGMSIEPHLHIQAHAKTFTGLPFYKEPQLLITFGGREYRLFDEIKAAD